MTGRVLQGFALSDIELDERAEFEAWKREKAEKTRRAALQQAQAEADAKDEDAADADGQAAQAVADVAPPVKTAPQTTRRLMLHMGHFAFFRSYIQGLDIYERWDHYLSQHGAVTDVRSVNSAVKRLRADLAAVALRHARPGMARLVNFDVNKIAQLRPARDIPTLEDFAFEMGMEDFPIKEQLRSYTEQYGEQSKRQQAHARLLRKQIAALHWLESLAAGKPGPDDAVAAWLIPELADPITEAGVVTLRQLAERINGMGLGWAASMRAIGAGKAARVVAWMRAVAKDTQLAIGAHVDIPRRQQTAAALSAVVAPATAVVPIEKFIMPPVLSGRDGRFRIRPAAQCMLGVDNDFDAMLEFIRAKSPLHPAKVEELKTKWLRAHPGEPLPDGPLAWTMFLSTTASSYLQEVYRFLLWAVLERRKAVSSIDFADAAAYRDFMANPSPADTWCSKARGRERYGPAWRPFAGPLGVTAATRAITILGAFYGFLRDKGYMMANPFSGLEKPRAAPAALEGNDTGRSLTSMQWRAINDALDVLPETSANLRLCFGLRCMYATGLRRAEAVAATVGDLHWVSYPPDDDDPEIVEGWELHVVGKGGVARVVPVPPGVIEDLRDYLVTRGLSGDLHASENKPVHLLGQAVDIASRAPWAVGAVPAFDPRAGIGAQTWYDQLTGFFKRCAEQRLAAGDAESAAQLSRATTHFLRHTKVTHSLAAGTPTDIERQVAGHRSLDTTSHYSSVEAKRRMRGSQRFFQSWGVRRGESSSS